MNKTNTVYVCDSITLCQITLADAYDIFSTINSQREFLGKWLPFVAATKTVSDSIAFVQSVLNAPPEQTELVYTIQYNKAFAGIIGFKDTDRLNGKTEIGYWLSEPLQGKGIVTKSTKKLIEIAFEKEQMNRIQIKCAVDNLPSKRIPQRLSFTLEGIEREGELLANKEYTDLEVYSLLRSDYERNKHIYINNIYER